MAEEKHYYVYIATNHPRHTVLYIGITNGLTKREGQHKEKWSKKSFAAKYNTNKVVYFEIYGDVNMAITREKQIKGWVRQKKLNLINNTNPQWKDLVDMIYNNNPEIDIIIKRIEDSLLEK